MANNLGIIEKSKLSQLFCKHNDKQWFIERSSGFKNIDGELRINICKDCGKKLGSYFANYQGKGFK